MTRRISWARPVAPGVEVDLPAERERPRVPPKPLSATAHCVRARPGWYLPETAKPRTRRERVNRHRASGLLI